jgi:hypothetical protein
VLPDILDLHVCHEVVLEKVTLIDADLLLRQGASSLREKTEGHPQCHGAQKKGKLATRYERGAALKHTGWDELCSMHYKIPSAT